MDLTLGPLLGALALALVHLLAGRLRFLSRVPRSRWLSFAGGISVAYVFVHLLPELGEGQEGIEADDALLPFLEHHVYLVALAGLALFYGVERSSVQSRSGRREAELEDHTGPGAFALSVGSFALYNAVIGYLLVHREESGARSLLLFSIALGVHFVVNDFGLQEHHKHGYERIGRWLLAAAVVVGWAIGTATEISDAAIALLLAFVGGGVILNVIKEELPSQRQSRFVPFITGTAAYAALLELI